MQDEAEKPDMDTRDDRPSRIEILLVGAAWALLAITLFAGLRIWSGASN